MSGIKIKAILLGVATDIGGSLVAGVALGIGVGVLMLVSGSADLAQLAEMESPLWMLATGYFLGIAFSLLGGFVAGRVAKEREVLHGGLTGLAAATIGLLFSFSSPLWFVILGFVSVPPAAMLGGRLARR